VAGIGADTTAAADAGAADAGAETGAADAVVAVGLEHAPSAKTVNTATAIDFTTIPLLFFPQSAQGSFLSRQ
jgi:hypothetical protein